VYVKSDDVISPTNETLQWTYLRSRGNEIESDEAGNPLWRAVCSVSWANSAPPFTRAYESAAHANFTAQHASTFVTYNGTLSAPTSVGGQDGCLTYAAADGVATTNYRIPTDFVTRQGVWYWVQFDIYATSNAPASVLLKMAFYLSDDNGTWGGGTIATGRCEMVLLSNTMLHDLSAMAVDLRNRTSQWVRVAFLFSPTAQFTARGNCLRIVPGGYWSGGALTDGLSYSIKNFTLTEIGDDGAKNAFLQNQ